MGSGQSVIRVRCGPLHSTCPTVLLGQKVKPPAVSEGRDEGPALGKRRCGEPLWRRGMLRQECQGAPDLHLKLSSSP